jgi:hypothetical protein
VTASENQRRARHLRTTCKLGHPLDYETPSGVRGCTQCRTDASRRARARRMTAA